MSKRHRSVFNAKEPYQARAAEMVLNAMMMRDQWIRGLADPRRDVDEECRYPRIISPQDYARMYKRFGVAKRVVNIEPMESWKNKPEIYDSEDSEETEFETSLKDLDDRHKIYSWMKKIDGISGINRFGVLLIGVDDGQELDMPVRGVPKSGVLEPGYKIPVTGRKILFIRAFDESMVRIGRWEVNPQSPRYGMPAEYEFNLLAPEDLTEGISEQGYQLGRGRNSDVHWTRVLHFTRNTTSSEVFGTPEQEDVYNHLLDLKKICGAGAEGYWQGAFPGLSFETQKDLENFDLDIAGLKKEARKYFEGLQRHIATVGMNVKSLAPNVLDPAAQFETAIKAICTTKGYPYRVFMGTEEGKLAGAQDNDAWDDRMAFRCEDHNTPIIVRPIINRFIMYGVLPTPLEQRYMVEWPDPHKATDQDIAKTAQIVADAFQKYLAAGADEIIAPEDFMIQILKMDPKVVKKVLDNAVKRIQSVNAGEIVPGGGPSPEEIAAQAQQDLMMKQAGKAGANGKPPAVGGKPINGKPVNGKPANGKPAKVPAKKKGAKSVARKNF